MPRVRGLDERQLDGLISRFEGVVGRVLRRIARTLAKLVAARSSVAEADVSGLLPPLRAQWEQHVDREVLPAVSTVYRRASTVLAEQLASYGYDLPDLLTADEYLGQARNRLVGVADTVWESIRATLVEGARAGDSVDGLAARVRAASGFGEGRARTIARTEVVAANNAASLATALAADDGSIRKEWLATPDTDGTGCDERTRAAHCAADGQTRPLTEPFDVGGAPLMFPGDPTGPPELVINCRCAPGYVFDEQPVMASVGNLHLPGKHDQSRHGRKRVRAATDDPAGMSGESASKAAEVTQATAKARQRRRRASPKRLPAGVKPSADIVAAGELNRSAQIRVKKAMAAAYAFVDAATGLRTRIDQVEVWPGSTSAVTTFAVLDADGIVKGSGRRTWHVIDGKLLVSHSELLLYRDVQGGGFAARFNAQAEELYREAGADEIRLHADMDVGGYAWAIAGYDFRSDQDLANTARRLASHVAQTEVDERTRAQVQDLVARATAANFAAGSHPTPFEFAMAGRHVAAARTLSGGRQVLMWPGKQAMLGSDWQGRKRLTAPVAAAATGVGLLDEVAANALAYAEAVADTVPAFPEDVDLFGDGPSEYPAAHHLFSAPPEVEQVLLDLADEVLDGPVTATHEEPAMNPPDEHLRVSVADDMVLLAGDDDDDPISVPLGDAAVLADSITVLADLVALSAVLDSGDGRRELDGVVVSDHLSVSVLADGSYLVDAVTVSGVPAEVELEAGDGPAVAAWLRDLAGAVPPDTVTAAASEAGNFHRPGGRDHDQSTHGRKRRKAPDLPAAAPNSDAPPAGADGLARNTVPQLRQMARDRGIRVPSRARKADIVALLADTPEPAPTPTTEPPPATTAVQAVDGQVIADRAAALRQASTRQEAETALAGLDGKHLRAVATEIGVTVFRSPRLADIRDAIVGYVQRRLDGEAIERVASGRGEDSRGRVIVAAAEVHTGAMVALVPSAEDAARLAMDGGEDPDQLHVTLAYLGEAADIPDETRQRIVDAVRQIADGLPVGEADGFAVSAFNPGDVNDRDTCIVLGLSGDGLENVHGAVEEALANLQGDGGFTLPDQHSPWIPHLTVAYTDDLSMVEQLADRVGPVIFDRLRVAFAGDNVDIPLGRAGEPEADDEFDVDWGSYFAQAIEAFVQSDAKLREYWVHGEGAAKIRWGTSGDFGRCVRQLRRYVRDPEGLCAEYHKEATGVWPGSKTGHASESEDTMAADTLPAGEAMPEMTEEDCPERHHRMPDGECMPDTTMTVDTTAQPGEHFHTQVMEGVSTGMRQFAPGAITWRDVPFAYHWQYKSSAHNGVPETMQVGLVTRAEREGDTVHFWGRLDLRSPEGLDYARRLAEGFARWSSVGADESLKDRDIDVEYVLADDLDGEPVEGGEINEMTFRAYRVAEVSAVSVPALADAAVEPTQELIDALTEMGVIAPAEQGGDEAVEEPADEPVPVAAAGPIVAGAYTVTIPDLPPASWFDEPVDASPHGELRVEESGRIYGYLAPKGVAHRSFRGRRVEVPMGRVDYGGWMNKPWPVAEGHKVYVGVITMECGHASVTPGDHSYVHRREHYDNSCSVAAHARIGENRHGVWIAGALAPWIDAEKLGKMMSCQLSGDWDAHKDRPGWRDFVAALLVPVEGFPKRVPHATVRVAEGALVASAVPVRMVHTGQPADDTGLRSALERIARSIGRDTDTRMAQLAARVHRHQ